MKKIFSDLMFLWDIVSISPGLWNIVKNGIQVSLILLELIGMTNIELLQG